MVAVLLGSVLAARVFRTLTSGRKAAEHSTIPGRVLHVPAIVVWDTVYQTTISAEPPSDEVTLTVLPITFCTLIVLRYVPLFLL